MRLVARKPTNPKLKSIAADRSLLENLGSFRLPEEYLDWQSGPLRRSPKEISMPAAFGNLLYLLVSARRPKLAVEAGTGFGISGAYIALALAGNKSGSLLTFEVGQHAHLAQQIIAKYLSRALVIRDRFDVFDQYIGATAEIDFLLLDAIHHGEVVSRQLRSVLGYCAPKAVIVIDDAYQRGNGDLLPALKKLISDRRVSFAATIGRRLFVCVIR